MTSGRGLRFILAMARRVSRNKSPQIAAMVRALKLAVNPRAQPQSAMSLTSPQPIGQMGCTICFVLPVTVIFEWASTSESIRVFSGKMHTLLQ